MVFSGLEPVKELIGKSCPHFDSKGKIEQCIRESGIDYTFVRYSFYAENFLTMMRPTKEDDGSFTFTLPTGDYPLDTIFVREAGECVKNIFKDFAKYKGQNLAGARNVAPISSRPLPTVTVHPQTSSSSTSVRVPQESPAYGYSSQNAYHNGQPGPRFSVAPQLSQRPQQRPQIPQGGPPQISPGPRPAAYPQSPIQPSPPQHMLQQPLRPEHQPVPRLHHPVSIRPSAPVQMHSPPQSMNQHGATQTQQQPGMVHYQQVAGPPRQVATAQPSVAQPGLAQGTLRSPQPAAPGLPPGAGQPPHVASPTLRGKEPPPKPSVSIAVVTSGIVLSWNMPLEDKHAPVMNYQLFALQDGSSTETVHQWKKIGVVKALPLPMACTLTQFLPGNKYHFAVRGTDELGRLGPFSDPCTITLK